VNLTIGSRVIFADALASVPGLIAVINQPPHMVTFRVALRDEFDPFANVSIQTTERSVYSKNVCELKWRMGTTIITVILQNEKKATCEFFSSNEQKNEINRSDPLFLAETASVSKDHRTSNRKERLLRDLWALPTTKRLPLGARYSVREDNARKLYGQSGVAIASIRYGTWHVHPTDNYVCHKGQRNVRCNVKRGD
jgi:hypothetical protein